MKNLDMSKFAFGEGAFIDDGVPVSITFANCKGTIWVRALDFNMMADLADDGVDLTMLFKESDSNPEEVELRPNVLEIVKDNREKFRKVVRKLLVRFDGFKRSDETPIPFNDETKERMAGYPEFVFMVILAAWQVSREIEGNSESSSDGSSTQTAEPNGEPTSATAETEA